MEPEDHRRILKTRRPTESQISNAAPTKLAPRKGPRSIISNAAPTKPVCMSTASTVGASSTASSSVSANVCPTKRIDPSRCRNKVQSIIANAAPDKPSRLPISPLMRQRQTSRAESSVPSMSDIEAVGDQLAELNVSHSESDRISMETRYVGALKRSEQIFVIGDREAVAVAGWDEDKDQIDTRHYCILTAVRFQSMSGTVSLLECTCVDSRVQNLDIRGTDRQSRLTDDFIENTIRNYCIHRSILPRLQIELLPFTDNDNSDGEIEQMEPDHIEQHVTEPQSLWSVRTSGRSYGMVRRTRATDKMTEGFFCLTCRKEKCTHVYTFASDHEACGIELPPMLPPEVTSPILSKCQIHIREGIWATFQYPAQGDFAPVAPPQCEHGHEWKKRVMTTKCTIYDLLGRRYDGGKVEKWTSKGPCACVMHFDGADQGLINVNDREMVEYRLLVYYMGQLARDGRPLIAFYDSLVFSNGELDTSSIPRDILYRAWTGFADLLVFDESSSFCCSECGREPEFIILDGTALSCRRDRMPKIPSAVSENARVLHGCSHDERVFIPEQKTRRLLHRFATGQAEGKKAMEIADVHKLLERIGKEFPGSPLQQLLVRLTLDAQCEADKAYREFLVEIAKNTPICAHFQVADDFILATAALQRIVSGEIDIAAPENLEYVRRMRVWFPGILSCLRSIRLQQENDRSLPVDVRNVIGMMVAKWERLLDGFERRSNDDYSEPSESEHPLSFFPSWPLQRGPGRYTDERQAKDEADSCNKYRHGHKVLGPGIMVYLCPHGICYGFSVMESYESPRMPFEVFTMRKYIPRNIIYDNACKLHVYCLKREPSMFNETRFFVDRFHWKNHRACSNGYSMDHYLCDKRVTAANSQVAEQLNSCLQKLRRSLSYMTYAKFSKSLKLFLYLYNRKKRMEK